jgi:hypothetical protein
MENGLNNLFAYSTLALYNNFKSVTPPTIISHIPSPTDYDYSNGYIERYFLQKSNDINSHIIEISANDIQQSTNNYYYTVASLTWRLTGSPQEIMDSNAKSIKSATTTIPNLSHYLSNLLQFAKVK